MSCCKDSIKRRGNREGSPLLFPSGIGFNENRAHRRLFHQNAWIDQSSQALQAELETLAVERAVHLAANAAGLDQACTLQFAQVPGDERLADAEQASQGRHSYFILPGEVIDNGET